MAAPAPADHFWWLAGRASGLVALALMTVSVLVGLGMATGKLRLPGLPKALNGLHEHLSVAALIAIGLHGATLLGDPWLRPGLSGVLVPFVIDYRSLWVAAGILAGYAAAALGLSYYARRRLGSARWRSAHRFVILAWGLSVVHALGAGTDTSLAVVRWPLIGSLVAVTGLGAFRILARQPKGPTSRPVAVAGQGKPVAPAAARIPARGA